MKVGTIDQEMLDRIISENDLREVAEEYGVVFGAGNKAPCPFHKEGSSPNLHYFAKNNTYYCYCATCRAGSRWEDKEKTVHHKLKLPDGVVIEDGGPTVIGFIMNIERCSYIEACVMLMERVGIPVPKAKVDRRLEQMKQTVTDDNRMFCEALLKDEKMLAYLDSRHIRRESIKKFRLGVVPKTYQHESFGNMLRGRLVFGITEINYNPRKAKTIAMAFRDLEYVKGSKEHPAKYINDKESDIYHKSSILYGLNEGRKAIREAGYAIVLEGYTDVIISHQCGVENVVATCGTAFTDEQMDMLAKLTKRIYFWYDGDAAGKAAMLASIERLLQRGFRVYIIDSTPLDPAEQMIALGEDAKRIRNFIRRKAVPAHIMIAEEVMREYEVKLSNMRAEVLDELMPIIDVITDDTERILFKTTIAQRLGVQL